MSNELKEEKKMNPVLQVKQVEKYFGRANNLTRALNQISFEVQSGEFVAIMGASGSGENDFAKLYSDD